MHHHLVSEEGLKAFCIYCNAEIPAGEWKSEWHLRAHYKTFRCKCGKDLHLKMNFDGSGHDSWNGISFKPKAISCQAGEGKSIEDRITVLERTKIVERHYPKGK